jgi:TonB family protein
MPVQQPLPTPTAAETSISAHRAGEGYGLTGLGDAAGNGSGRGEGTSGSGSDGLADRGAGDGAGRRAAPQGAQWIVKPSDAEMQRHNPMSAKRRGISGTVVLACFVDSDSRTRGCRVVKEGPKGYGFAAAVLRMSRSFQIKPPLVDGKPRYDVPVTIPIFFDNHRH